MTAVRPGCPRRPRARPPAPSGGCAGRSSRRRSPAVPRPVRAGRRRRRGRRLRRRSLVTAAGAAALLGPGRRRRRGLHPPRGRPAGDDWWVLELAPRPADRNRALARPVHQTVRPGVRADVFHDNPQTGKSYILLTDIVYYLIFTAYVLFTVHFEPREWWGTRTYCRPDGHEPARLGGILLIIGVLHGLNIVLMPVLGRLLAQPKAVRPVTARPERWPADHLGMRRAGVHGLGNRCSTAGRGR